MRLLYEFRKYEKISLFAYDSIAEARKSIMRYLDWYNRNRPHSKLEKKTPDEAYAVMLPTVEQAA
ncbi:integrase core domain-containing protein [Desulfogranum mediterraneum]|uniref:integrase core domain-containing protein n=1 Tax=Desulfogranum mediterraneum TaxID=160661 RepID=UPI0003F7E079